jgi:hypothetical protein
VRRCGCVLHMYSCRQWQTHLSHFSLMTTYCSWASLRPAAAAAFRLPRKRGMGTTDWRQHEHACAGKVQEGSR